jgi:hypothetical protein
LAQRLGPRLERGGKFRRGDQAEDAIEGVVRRDAVGQSEPSLEPGVLTAPPERDVGEALGAAEPGADGDHQDVEQFMPLGWSRAWIGDGLEVVFQLAGSGG